MPIYEYECQSCKRSFEYMQSISEPPKATCEACGGKLEKQISPAGFILKGGGWYKDLYASPKPGGGGGGDKSSGSDKPAADKPSEKKDSGSSSSSSSSSSSPSSTSTSTEKKK